MTTISWDNKKIGNEKYIVPSPFAEFYSAWILVKSRFEADKHFVSVKIGKNCVDLSIRHLKKAYSISLIELEYDPIALYQILIEKIELIIAQYNRFVIPLNKIYRDLDEIWFTESLFKTVQKSLKWQNKAAYFSPLYTETPFGLSICKDRCILDTKREFLTEGHSSKNFFYSADTRHPCAPLLRITSKKNNSEEFEREWNIYNYILACYRETGEMPEGLMVPWCLLTVGQEKIIYLPIGKPYFFIPLSKEQLSIALSLIKGLMTLHYECLVHGDPKLSNFVLVDGKARWLDFGSTVPFGTNLKHCYTQGYHAPEYFLDRERNMVLLDVYALGVTLYEIHYGRKPPYIYDSFTTFIQKHAEWCSIETDIPIVKVIKGFMNPDKDKRMRLKEGLKILEEANRPTQVS